jgi:hypothetical protein
MALVVTGAKALIKLSGEVLAFATGVSVDHDNNLEEIPQLDSLEIAEYAENGHRCTISITTIKLAANASLGGNGVSNTATDYGFDYDIARHNFDQTKSIASAATGVPNDYKKLKSGDINQILLQPELIIEIVEIVPVLDRSGKILDYTEAAIYTGFGAKFAGGNGQIDARGIWQGRWSFKCRRGVGI